MSWLVGPGSRPADLGTRLQAHGLVLDGEAPGMALDLAQLPDADPLPSDGTIVEVEDDDGLARWIDTCVEGSELPGVIASMLHSVHAQQPFRPAPDVHYFLAQRGSEPVATSLLVLGGGVAGIYCVATLPSARRQGIGSAVTAAALRVAQTQCYRVGVLLSSPMGLGVYHRLGFREYCTISLYFG
jgi:ribosomal protein S18 acetylase RimI-like enzyme